MTIPSRREHLEIGLWPLAGSSIGFVLLACLAWVLLIRSPSALAGKIFPMAAAVTAACLFNIAYHRRTQIPGDRRPNFLGATVFLWAASALIALLAATLFGNMLSLVTTAQLLLLAGYPSLAAWAYYCLPGSRRHFTGLRVILDMLVSSITLTAIAALLFIDPISEGSSAGFPELFWAMAFPLADLALIVVVLNVLLVSDLRANLTGIRLAVLALLALLVGDMLSAYQQVRQEGLVAPWAIFCLVVGHCLIALPGLLKAPDNEREDELSASRRMGLRRRIQFVLPYASTVLLVWYLVIDYQLNQQVSIPLVSIGGLCILLLILRQGVIAGEAELGNYAFLVNSAAEPAFIVNGNGELKLINPAFTQATGVSLEKRQPATNLAGMVVTTANFPMIAEEAVRGGWSGEVLIRRVDGSRFPAFLALRAIPGGLPGALLAGTAHDLTDQKRQQDALHEANAQLAAAKTQLENFNIRLEQRIAERTFDLIQVKVQLEQQNLSLMRLDEAKSDFVSLVSHELRAPLTNISLGIELILDKPALLPANTVDSLRLVQGEIARLNRFVETILDVSILDAGQSPFLVSPIALDGVVAHVRKTYQGLPGGDRLFWKIPEGIQSVLADEQALISVLVHLIDNACKYAPEGPVEVEAVDGPDDQIEVRVSDCGPGIPANMIPLLFDKFFRLHHGDSQEIYGHGLGLYITRRLLRMMDGDIRVENRPTGGTSFIFSLRRVDDGE